MDDIEIRDPQNLTKVLCLGCVIEIQAGVPPTSRDEIERMMREQGLREE